MAVQEKLSEQEKANAQLQAERREREAELKQEVGPNLHHFSLAKKELSLAPGDSRNPPRLNSSASFRHICVSNRCSSSSRSYRSSQRNRPRLKLEPHSRFVQIELSFFVILMLSACYQVQN